MDASTPTARPTMGDESALDTTLGDPTTSHISMFPKADDSLLSSVLLHKEPTQAHGEGQTPPTSSESESPERIQRQLEQLRQLNEMFESYERALQSSLAQTEAFARRISETDALLDSYTNLMLQAQRRRTLLNDENWRGATQVRCFTADKNQQAVAEQMHRQEQRQAKTKRQETGAEARGKGRPASSIPTRAPRSGASQSRPRASSRPGAQGEPGTTGHPGKRAGAFPSTRGSVRGESSLPVRGGRSVR